MRLWVMIAFILSISMLPMAVAQAESDINIQNHEELSLEKTYDFRDDPFLLEWTFGMKAEVASAPVETEKEMLENKILARWKAKQVTKWSALPQEKFIVNASAYTAAADECGNSRGITSSGLKVEEGRTLACPPEFPFGAKIYIEGVGERRCEDRGGAIKGNHVDIYMETKSDAFAFGRQNLSAYVID